jgi:hypothetical protein
MKINGNLSRLQLGARLVVNSASIVSVVFLGVIVANLSKQRASVLPIHLSLPGAGQALSVTVQEGPVMPLGRGSHAGGMVDGQLVIATGTSWNAERTKKSFLSDTLSLKGTQWTPGPALPSALAEGAYASDGESLYLAGGLKSPTAPSDAVYRMSKVGGTLTVQKLTALPTPITASAGAIARGRLFVACGVVAGKASKQLLSLDLEHPNSTWTENAALPGPARAYAGLVAVGDDLYLLGGLADGNGSVHARTLGDCYRYDSATDQWSSVGNLPVPGYCWSAAPVGKDQLLLTGRADGVIHDEVWLLDLKTLTGHIAGRTVVHATCAPLVEVSPGTFWLIGGEPDSNKNRTNRISEISVRSTVQ